MDATVRFDTQIVGALPVIVQYLERMGLPTPAPSNGSYCSSLACPRRPANLQTEVRNVSNIGRLWPDLRRPSRGVYPQNCFRPVAVPASAPSCLAPGGCEMERRSAILAGAFSRVRRNGQRPRPILPVFSDLATSR